QLIPPQGTVSLSWSIKNTGGKPAAPFQIQFFGSTTTLIGPPAPVIATLELPTLPAGQTLSDVTSANVPKALTTGTYFVGMVVNADNRIVEVDSRNNT